MQKEEKEEVRLFWEGRKYLFFANEKKAGRCNQASLKISVNQRNKGKMSITKVRYKREN
jgi:hypothetical protein